MNFDKSGFKYGFMNLSKRFFNNYKIKSPAEAFPQDFNFMLNKTLLAEFFNSNDVVL
jgi:hypothetical protein